MVEAPSKLKKKFLSAQTRELVSNVAEFMRNEASRGKPIISFAKVEERLSKATGLSLSTIRKIGEKDSDIKVNNSLQSPLKTKPVKPRADVNDHDKGMLRCIMHNFYLTHKMIPNLERIHGEFVESTGYTGSVTSMHRGLREIGFRWIKTTSNKKILMEKADVRLQRIRYLKTLQQYREENRTIVFMDETYLHPQQTSEKTWTGQRVIIVHAWYKYGGVPNATLIFQSKTNSGDYHNDMSFENYKKWISEKLIPNLPWNSVVVVGNAPYHNIQVEKCPNYYSKKEVMIQWLRSRNIMCDVNMLKVELYNLIKLHKPGFKTFQIDELFLQKGHNVIRLPPNHSDLNPTDLIWTSLKAYVAQHYRTYGDVMNLADHFLKSFSTEEWTLRYHHVENMEKEYLKKELALDAVLDQLIINTGAEDESAEEDPDEPEENENAAEEEHDD